MIRYREESYKLKKIKIMGENGYTMIINFHFYMYV